MSRSGSDHIPACYHRFMKRPESESDSDLTSDPVPDDWEPDTDHDGSLIRWMLGLSPAKRLEALQDFADGVAALQNARKISQ